MKEKIGFIFKPFLLALIVLTVGYTFIHWLFLIKLNLFSLKSIVTNFGVPIVLAGITAWIVLRPKLKILKLETKNGSIKDLYTVIIWIALIVPLAIAQDYIVTATGKLTQLTSIGEINSKEATKYYTLKNHYINKKNIGVHTAFDVSGKNNDKFNMHIYVAMPILENQQDTLTKEPAAWLGIDFSKSISNGLDQKEKESQYQEFANESQEDLDNKNVAEFVYLDRIGSSDEKEGFIQAIKNNKDYTPNETILVGINKPFEARNGNKLLWIFGSALIGSIIVLAMILIPKVHHERLKHLKSGIPDNTAKQEKHELLEMLKPKEGYFITPILIYINIGVYLLMALSGLGFLSFKGEDLYNWGANYGPSTKDGQWWRLLTSMFLHGGLMHLMANMYGLLFVGIFLEPLLGRTKYLLGYLVTGLIASVASIWWYEATVSVGASGAIFGLYGIFFAFLLLKIFPPDFAKSFLASTAVFIGFNLLMGLKGGIDNAAHIGGLLSGFIIGLALYPLIKKKTTHSDLIS